MKKKIQYSEEQLQHITDLFNNGVSLNKIRIEMQCSYETIVRVLEDLGLREKKVSEKKEVLCFEDEILNPWLEGKSLYKLNQEYKMSKATMAKRLRELGYDVENNHAKIKFDDTVFDCVDSEEKAYWLGFIYADGNISKHNTSKESYSTVIALKATDIEHLYKFCELLKYPKENVKVYSKKLYDTFYEQCRVDLRSRHMWESLNKLGVIPCKTLVITFPDKSIFKDESLVRHFIRGYFDGMVV